MISLRQTLACICITASCLLAVAAAGPALADDHAIDYHAGPTTMVLTVNNFGQFHATLTNGGDLADSYTLTVSAAQPANWTFGVCYDGVCYPPDDTVFTIPAAGTLAPGESMEFDYDVTTLSDQGAGTYNLEFVSNSDPSVVKTCTYTVYTPSEPVAMEFATGDVVIATTVNNFVAFHPILYNAGTLDDTYSILVERDLPADWTATYCYDGVCYGVDDIGGLIPDGPGTIASGEAVPIDLDFTTLTNPGTGSMTVYLVSNTDGSVAASETFYVTTEALADVVEFGYHQGYSEMVMGVNEFGQFHSAVTNVGDVADSYTLTVTDDDPANWTFGVCFGGICYPPTQTVFTVPAEGFLDVGEELVFDFDVTTLIDSGSGSYTVELVSNTDPANAGSWTYEVFTPTEPSAMVLAHDGNGVTGTTVNNFVQTHCVLYNAGTDDDTYTLSIDRNIPANWTVSFCYDGICYPSHQDSGQIPDGAGTIASGQAVPIDIDFTTLMDEGTGSATITVVSNNNPSLRRQLTWVVTTGSVVAVNDIPVSALLSDLHAAPNPFNPRTDIRFTVGGTSAVPVLVDIHDVTGRRVRTIQAGLVDPGGQSLTWNGLSDQGRQVAAGVYLARVRVGRDQQIIKLSLVK